MKFFSKDFMTPEHIQALKQSRKVKVKNKVVNHNGNFVEFVNMESGLRVFPENDELLRMINEIEIFDPIISAITTGEYKNYDYGSLPPKLKKYMREMDALFFTHFFNNQKKTIEDYDFDRREEMLAKMIPDYTDDDFERHVVLGHSFPSTIGRKAKESARRAYKTVSGLFRSNIDRFQSFVTFTFAMEENKEKYQFLNDSRGSGEYDLQFEYIDPKNFEECKKAFSKVVNSMGKQLKRKGIPFEYIAVWEIQRNGNYHFHMLCSEIPKEMLYKVPEWLDFDFRNNKLNNGYGLTYWNHGKSDIQFIKDPSKITTYMSKYIIKSFYNVNEDSYEEYLNKKKYFPSRGLDKPTSEYMNDSQIDKVMNQLELESITPFEKEYENPYNGKKIVKKLYSKCESDVDSIQLEINKN